MLPKKTNRPFYLFSAPICGFTRFPFRKILSRFPVDLIFTEMVSIDALFYDNPQTLPLLAIDKKDKTPVAVQLVGSKIDLFLKAVEKIANMGFFSYDINLGCPVKKVLKNEAGSFLLQKPEKIYLLFKSLKSHFPHLIFSGKIRLGYSFDNQNYLENARAVEEGGASFLTVHGRTRCQMYSGEVNLEAIREIKKKLRIPVIGNGGIFTPQDAMRMLSQTGCDGVMVARGMLGNPWIFRQIEEYFFSQTITLPTYEERITLLLENFLLELEFDSTQGFKEFKKTAAAYLRGLPHASFYRKVFVESKTPEEMRFWIEDAKKRSDFH